ncbi:hypothetical protein FHT76_008161 [Rhizobium sp. BK176]|nr:hypothetical protein [Rhizobium sp. BK176]
MSVAYERKVDVMPIESSKSGMSWGSIFGGAVAATGATFCCLSVQVWG